MMRFISYVLTLCLIFTGGYLVGVNVTIINAEPAPPSTPLVKYVYITPEPEIIEHTIIETVTETVYVPEWKEWDSATELRAWLKQDDTDQQEYIVDKHDCDDFCIDLSMRAAEDGYYIGIRASDIYNRKWHMDNFAVIGNDVYKIEPQNDYCVKWDRLD